MADFKKICILETNIFNFTPSKFHYEKDPIHIRFYHHIIKL